MVDELVHDLAGINLINFHGMPIKIVQATAPVVLMLLYIYNKKRAKYFEVTKESRQYDNLLAHNSIRTSANAHDSF